MINRLFCVWFSDDHLRKAEFTGWHGYIDHSNTKMSFIWDGQKRRNSNKYISNSGQISVFLKGLFQLVRLTGVGCGAKKNWIHCMIYELLINNLCFSSSFRIPFLTFPEQIKLFLVHRISSKIGSISIIDFSWFERILKEWYYLPTASRT